MTCNKYLMNFRFFLLVALLAVTNSKTLNHQQTSNLACCPNGMVFDQHILTCVCPAGTSPSGPNKICCPPGTIGTPQGTCGCSPPNHLNPVTKHCETCPTNHVWDSAMNQCLCPASLPAVNATNWCTCAGTSRWSPTTNSCETCPNNKVYN
jgi:hypothetical protein